MVVLYKGFYLAAQAVIDLKSKETKMIYKVAKTMLSFYLLFAGGVSTALAVDRQQNSATTIDFSDSSASRDMMKLLLTSATNQLSDIRNGIKACNDKFKPFIGADKYSRCEAKKNHEECVKSVINNSR